MFRVCLSTLSIRYPSGSSPKEVKKLEQALQL